MTNIKRSSFGWSSGENDLLISEINAARENREPLSRAFRQVAEKTGRKPNSVRNYYYALVRDNIIESAYEKGAFTPFTQAETEELLFNVLNGLANGKSVRSVIKTLGGGDSRLMLRYQNKYRSVVKNDPDTVMSVINSMRSMGINTFDPYKEESPSKSGRKPKSKNSGDIDTEIYELAQSLKRLKNIDALRFIRELSALAKAAGRD